MPLRLPRRTLGLEIVLSLAVKAAALLAIAILLFGPHARPPADPASVGAAITGERP